MKKFISVLLSLTLMTTPVFAETIIGQNDSGGRGWGYESSLETTELSSPQTSANKETQNSVNEEELKENAKITLGADEIFNAHINELKPSAPSKTRAYNVNRNYNNYNVWHIELIGNADSNGNTGLPTDYYTLSADGRTLTMKPIYVNNPHNFPYVVTLYPDFMYERYNASTGLIEEVSSKSTSFSGQLGVHAQANTNGNVISSTSWTVPAGCKIKLDNRTQLIHQAWGTAPPNIEVTGTKSLVVTNSTTLTPTVNYQLVNRLNLRVLNYTWNESGTAYSATWGYPKNWTFVRIDDGSNKVTTVNNTQSVGLTNFPPGTYNWSYVPVGTTDLNSYPNAINTPPRSGTFTYTGGIQSFLYDAHHNQYATVSVGLFYDYNNNGIMDGSESLIDDPTESSKVSLSAYTAGGSTDAIFYNKSERKVYKIGQVATTYTGSKYTASAGKGVEITGANINAGDDVKVPAPVYVNGNPTFQLFYDTDRDNIYSSAQDKLANGKITINGVQYTVTNGAFTIPSIKSGQYSYTFVPTDSINCTELTGTITISPSGTPDTNGIIKYNDTLGLDIQNTVNVKPYYDNDYSGTFNTGDTVLPNVVNLTGADTLASNSSNLVTLWKTGTYNVSSINGLATQDIVLVKPSFTVTVDQMRNKATIPDVMVGIYPPSTVSGVVKDQWAKPVQGATFTYNGSTATTQADGSFTLTVSYSSSATNYKVTKTNYSTLNNSTTVKKTNNLGTIILPKAYFTVSGRILDNEGNLVKDAEVLINGIKTQTNSSGDYSLNVPIEN